MHLVLDMYSLRTSVVFGDVTPFSGKEDEKWNVISQKSRDFLSFPSCSRDAVIKMACVEVLDRSWVGQGLTVDRPIEQKKRRYVRYSNLNHWAGNIYLYFSS